jgi:antitoxin-like ribbon-helix-helix protein
LPEIGVTKRPTGASAAMAKQGAAAPEVVVGGSETRTLTLRLAPVVHDQLREMAYTSRRSQHSLLLEALDDLFRKHGKPPIPS